MPTSEESVCCQEIEKVASEIPENFTCITSNQLFHIMCLDQRIANIHYVMITNQPIQEDLSLHHRNLRRTAYRSFTSWIHGFLGKGVRIAIPSCAVAAVREAYPDPKGNYVGFVKMRDYCAMDMAFDF
ncbi:P2X purinoceptor 7-like [Xenopus tropicalis]|uniref:P2X purinoceptor 7-like n=1 Tax=Xenopus tropicalis TaxID=8364 RepID=A0A803JAW0_XENTR|nr:P2X purinoceptor 7-like [Xenopus tropicalis]